MCLLLKEKNVTRFRNSRMAEAGKMVGMVAKNSSEERRRRRRSILGCLATF